MYPNLEIQSTTDKNKQKNKRFIKIKFVKH